MDQPVDHRLDPLLFRRVMGRFATGVAVVAARWPDGAVRAMTANAFMSGSLEPPLCVVAVAKRARMHACLESAADYGISILAREQQPQSSYFAGRPVPGLDARFDDFGGVPVLPGALGWIACRKHAVHDCGDHSLFIGEIWGLESFDGEPLLYYAGRYGSLGEPAGEPGEDPPPL